VPWFISTAVHSDFSHGIACDFTSSLCGVFKVSGDGVALTG
jgi:hypothetical protein